MPTVNADTLQTIVIYALPVLLAITVHEAAHGYAARYFGDPTAALLGRLTLNPLKHIDPLGTILIPLLLFFASSGNFLFGYAKPVPVNTRQLNNPQRDMIWVALAGPMSNLAQALLWGMLWLLLQSGGLLQDSLFLPNMAQAGMIVNMVLWALNLFPLPPLDGGRVLQALLPGPQAQWLSRIEPYGFFIVLALVLTGIMSGFWLQPLLWLGFALLNLLLSPLRSLLI
jgi:Zn-dependent protease